MNPIRPGVHIISHGGQRAKYQKIKSSGSCSFADKYITLYTGA